MIGVIAASASGSAPPPEGIVNLANTTVVNQGGGVYRVTKSGGGDGVWDAAAASSVGASGDFMVRFAPLQAGKTLVAGIGDDPSGSDFGSIDRGLFLVAGGQIGVCVNGGWGGEPAGSPAWGATSHLFVRRIGAAVTALIGPSDDVAQASVIHSFADLAGTVYFDCSIHGAGAAVDVQLVTG